MILRWLLVIALVLPYQSIYTSSSIQLKDVPFYNTKFQIAFDPAASGVKVGVPSTTGPIDFAHSLSSQNADITLNTLEDLREEYRLNDWLYFLLVKNAAMQLYRGKDRNFYLMYTWYMLARSGYEVRLYHAKDRYQLFARTDETVYELPIVSDGNKKFVNISGWFDLDNKAGQIIYKCRTPYGEGGKPFSFQLTERPRIIKEQLAHKQLSFRHDNEVHHVNVTVDKSIIGLMRVYPSISLLSYGNIPLSAPAYNSLIPRMKELVQDRSPYEAARLLLSFTRSAFVYGSDEEYYKQANVVFTPEQTLLAPVSDCEDRAILFNYLVQEVLGLKAILVSFPTHISSAVAFDGEVYGQGIVHDGMQYTFCEPTGPQNHLLPGEIPKGYETQEFEIYQAL